MQWCRLRAGAEPHAVPGPRPCERHCGGYLIRAASQQDGRRTVLRLTEEGTALLNHFRHQQRQAFEYITRDWPVAERLEFALVEAGSDHNGTGNIDGPHVPTIGSLPFNTNAQEILAWIHRQQTRHDEGIGFSFIIAETEPMWQ